ncbi:redoxin domain-containing protein [Labilibaculum sp. A4]|uniref:TlpA family protein disulfide reductase n=1 Tax=Labilibaculum euxinus TaxID=2686357 RepID=UPI000F619A90|nr:TlpA disulfide reductase family protein [Labilibaculum euxinus]MDQ1770640.1 TlpA disulfide reductase family protein [Labilibaculum euxinus]MWN75140.1 redoxin domain-containing protein [Labilibaculum euxinus]
MHGKNVKLSDFKGKLIYIDFWDTWCRPCLGELPFYGKLIGKDVVFLSISVDQDKGKWQSFIKKALVLFNSFQKIWSQ